MEEFRRSRLEDLPRPKTLNFGRQEKIGRGKDVQFYQNVLQLKESMKEKDQEIGKLLNQVSVLRTELARKRSEYDNQFAEKNSKIHKLENANQKLALEVQELRREIKVYSSRDDQHREELRMKMNEEEKVKFRNRDLIQSEARVREDLMKIREQCHSLREQIVRNKQDKQTLLFKLHRQKKNEQELKKEVAKQKFKKKELKQKIKKYIEENVTQFTKMRNAVKKIDMVKDSEEMRDIQTLIKEQHEFIRSLRKNVKRYREKLKSSKRECVHLVRNHELERKTSQDRIQTLEATLKKTRAQLLAMNNNIVIGVVPKRKKRSHHDHEHERKNHKKSKKRGT